MAKIKQSPKMPAEQRRQQLLQAARALFMRKGYRGTTPEEVARHAGLTKGALYFHFGSKEEILFELVKAMHQELIWAVNSVPEKKASPAQLLKALLDAKPEAGTADFGSYLDFWVQASRIPKIRNFLRNCVAEYSSVFAGRIDRRYAPSKRDRHDLAVMIIAMHDGLTVRKMLGDNEVDFPRQLKLFTSLTHGKMETATEKSKT
jgi:AcrR family transcriptional regulator